MDMEGKPPVIMDPAEFSASWTFLEQDWIFPSSFYTWNLYNSFLELYQILDSRFLHIMITYQCWHEEKIPTVNK